MTIIIKNYDDCFDNKTLIKSGKLNDVFELFETDLYYYNAESIYFNKNYTESKFNKILLNLSLNYGIFATNENSKEKLEYEFDTNRKNILSKYFLSIEFVFDKYRKDSNLLIIGRDEYKNMYGSIKGKVFGADDTYRKPRCPFCGGEKLLNVFFLKKLQNDSDYSIVSSSEKVFIRCESCNEFIEHNDRL